MEITGNNKFSLFTAILININIMVGIGIFIAPSIMAQNASNLSFLAWPAIGLLFLPVVYSIAQITKFFPNQGSFYEYGEKQLGKSSGFVSGWFYFLGFASISALQLMGLKEVLIKQLNLGLIQKHEIVFNLIFISIFCTLNLLSVKFISKIQNTITLLKLTPLIFVILAMFFYHNPELQIDWGNIAQLRYALPLALFGFWGFESSCNISHMIKDSKKNAPRAILIAFFVTVFVYTVFHYGLLRIMNLQNLVNHGATGFVMFLGIKSDLLLSILNSSITSAIIIVFVSSIFGVFLSNSANLHAMASNDLFPLSKKIKELNKNERPSICIWVTGIAVFILLSLISNKIILNSICNFGIITTFVLTLASLLLIQLKQKLKGQAVITILGFFSCLFITYYSWVIIGKNNIDRILYTLPLLTLGILGFIMFKTNEKLTR